MVKQSHVTCAACGSILNPSIILKFGPKRDEELAWALKRYMRSRGGLKRPIRVIRAWLMERSAAEKRALWDRVKTFRRGYKQQLKEVTDMFVVNPSTVVTFREGAQ